jgi:Lrp/AsnC family leucine-responsive transcriptional regulator
MTKLSELDWKLLQELQRDCRSLQEIADKLNTPVSTLHYRVKRLEKEGVIHGYSAILNPNKIGLKFHSIIHVFANHGPSFEDLAYQIAEIQGVYNVYWVFGEVDFFVIAWAKDQDEYNQIIRRIMNIDGVQRTNSHVIAKVVKEECSFSF